MNLVLANGMLLVLVLVELGFLLFVRKEKVPWKEVVFNLNSGHIFMWVLRGIEISAFLFIAKHWSFSWIESWPYVLKWVFAFLAWDFCFYWLHRLHHKFPLLWAVHVVHHEGEHFSLSLGIRNSWYSSLTSLPFFVALALIGVPVEIFIATSSIHYFIQFYNHNRVVGKSGWLEKIMITPSHHRVHHGKNPEYLDRNFGGTLVIWDKLFGTFQAEINSVPIEFGVKDYKTNYNVLWANNLPFFKLLGIRNENGKPQSFIYRVSDYLIGTGGLLLFGLLLFYISIEGRVPVIDQAGLFAIIFLGTIALGGMSEGKLWGLSIWGFVFGILFPALLFYQQISDAILWVLSGLMVIHSLVTVITTSKYPIGELPSQKMDESNILP
ncbi:sterol desaturase family protein [bacterium SCSIO 12741]|nr:sterol desaturase family protein [bacterium SCSIO 12741]